MATEEVRVSSAAEPGGETSLASAAAPMSNPPANEATNGSNDLNDLERVRFQLFTAGGRPLPLTSRRRLEAAAQLLQTPTQSAPPPSTPATDLRPGSTSAPPAAGVPGPAAAAAGGTVGGGYRPGVPLFSASPSMPLTAPREPAGTAVDGGGAAGGGMRGLALRAAAAELEGPTMAAAPLPPVQPTAGGTSEAGAGGSGGGGGGGGEDAAAGAEVCDSGALMMLTQPADCSQQHQGEQQQQDEREEGGGARDGSQAAMDVSQPAMAMDMSQPQPQPQYGTPLPHGTGPEQHHESATPAGQTLYDDYTTWPVLRLRTTDGPKTAFVAPSMVQQVIQEHGLAADPGAAKRRNGGLPLHDEREVGDGGETA